MDPSYAQLFGGRWNPPASFPTLYLNADVETARLQVERLVEGSPLRPEELDDDAYVLVAATLPRAQRVADAVSNEGLAGLGLPEGYPLNADGSPVGRGVCQGVSVDIKERDTRGIWCRSACTSEGRGRELAWFPATSRSQAKPLWDRPRPLSRWLAAEGWEDIGLEEQSDPA